jgi:hypothetical protein
MLGQDDKHLATPKSCPQYKEKSAWHKHEGNSAEDLAIGN